MDSYWVKPDPSDPRLTETVTGLDQDGNEQDLPVVMERPLTLYLNGQEIVTLMTVGDHPEYLALGYFLNQNMLRFDDTVERVDYDEELGVVAVRTERPTNYEEVLKRPIKTSGCAHGTVFGQQMEKFEAVELNPAAVLHAQWIYALSKAINTTDSVYLTAGAIHGCVLCQADRPLIYMEDVGRHNAVDKIAGYMFRYNISPHDKIFYTTGRLTSEMVIKTVQMQIPVLLSRSGFTAWGVRLARQANLTLVGRAKGKRFLVLAGADRVVRDHDPSRQDDEPAHVQRKASRTDAA